MPWTRRWSRTCKLQPPHPRPPTLPAFAPVPMSVTRACLQVEPCVQESDHHVAEPGQEPSQPQPQRGPGQPVALPGGCQWLLHPGEPHGHGHTHSHSQTHSHTHSHTQTRNCTHTHSSVLLRWCESEARLQRCWRRTAEGSRPLFPEQSAAQLGALALPRLKLALQAAAKGQLCAVAAGAVYRLQRGPAWSRQVLPARHRQQPEWKGRGHCHAAAQLLLLHLPALPGPPGGHR